MPVQLCNSTDRLYCGMPGGLSAQAIDGDHYVVQSVWFRPNSEAIV